MIDHPKRNGWRIDRLILGASGSCYLVAASLAGVGLVNGVRIPDTLAPYFFFAGLVVHSAPLIASLALLAWERLIGSKD